MLQTMQQYNVKISFNIPIVETCKQNATNKALILLMEKLDINEAELMFQICETRVKEININEI